MTRATVSLFLLLALAACGDKAPESAAANDSETAAGDATAKTDTLALVLDAQPDEVKARYVYRNPYETLRFLGIEPGMTVVEALPGGGWYTRILLPFLGEQGGLLAVNYNLSLYPLFSFANEEMLDRQAAWQAGWQDFTADWRGEKGASTEAFHFGSLPERLKGTADVVFFARVLHNLARFQNAGESDFLDEALADAYDVLKPGGILGIVQHEAPDDKSDEWADGSRGYLKKSFVIAEAEKAGFEFMAESDINQNPKDQPGEDDIVWRLPPSMVTSGEDEAMRAAMQEIGESNRMTLKFRKPQ